MFGSSKEKTQVPSTNGAARSHNSLVKGTKIVGKVDSESDIRIDGEIDGTLTCRAKVVIGPTGSIKGTITCRDAVIEGRLEGNIEVTQLLHLKKSGKVEGEILTSKLVVEAGAVFNGKCNMGQKNMSSSNVRKATSNLKKEAS